MATEKQRSAAPRNIKGAELYQEAKRRNLSGRSKMGRAELARALGYS